MTSQPYKLPEKERMVELQQLKKTLCMTNKKGENIWDKEFVCPSLGGKRVTLALNAAQCLKSVVAKEVGKPVL